MQIRNHFLKPYTLHKSVTKWFLVLLLRGYEMRSKIGFHKDLGVRRKICIFTNIFSFYVDLQSSALGFLLAQKHFTNPLVAVPSAVSVVCMAVGPLAKHIPQLEPLSLNFVVIYDILSLLFSGAAGWKCSCSVLEKPANSSWWQGRFQGIGNQMGLI